MQVANGSGVTGTDVMVRALRAADAARWRQLWADYCRFYETDVPEDVTARTLSRLLDPQSRLVGRVAVVGDEVAGFSASVLHDATWDTRPVCYLEDLYVDAAARGAGLGRALIDDLVGLAREQGWGRVYWHTHANNAQARRLYDHYTAADEFVRYRLFL